MKAYLYGGVLLGLMAFAWWYGDTMKDAGIDETTAKYETLMKEALLEAQQDHERILASDRTVVEAKINAEQRRSQRLTRQLKQARKTTNEAKNDLNNLTLGYRRLFNDLRREYEAIPLGEPLTDAEAATLTMVGPGEFREWATGVAKQYYDLAGSMVALQTEIDSR